MSAPGYPGRGDLLVATRSAGKLRELVPLLALHGWQAITLTEAGIDETEDEAGLEAFATFEENALAKARHFSALAGGVVLADDSGLVVDALGGQPGVHSKRWCGRPDLEGDALDAANNAHLLSALASVGMREALPPARYLCAAAAVWPGGELVECGETAGRILSVARGLGGFGYDPYFESVELGRTFAEVDRAEKAAVSHRGRAFRALLARLSEGRGTSGQAPATNLLSPVDPGRRLG
ncbi:MAG: non-canonical purine NTP pyrophosphatase [Gemmatimonas sp.]|uniref:non-canonical purine NTP pyrophosphatase n=1 Tax=Gemmatimonas sp. TaxID=1962908 RepID=UPI00391F11FC|nr:non-canonical purine NTP pyrophosphatase [Gemmatimonadota bacterium]